MRAGGGPRFTINPTNWEYSVRPRTRFSTPRRSLFNVSTLNKSRCCVLDGREVYRMAEPLQPLRIPAGWFVRWNTLFEVDPTEVNVRRGYFGGSSLFLAIHERRRLSIDVEWRPEDDVTGEHHLKVECAPWERTAKG